MLNPPECLKLLCGSPPDSAITYHYPFLNS